MTRLKTILTLSVLIILLPFLGFPQGFDNFLYIIFGGIIFVFTYLLKKELYDRREFNQEGREGDRGSSF